MAAPKRKLSKSRRDRRRANWKLEAPNYVKCPRCQEPKLPHHVCLECRRLEDTEIILGRHCNLLIFFAGA